MSIGSVQTFAPTPVQLTSLVPGAPRVPQVNLLPPEIRASRSLRVVKRILLVVLAAILGVAVLGYLWSTTQVASANRALDAEQAETTRLLDAQLQYAEVPLVLNQLDAARRARLLGTSTEVLWNDYLTLLVTTAPPGVTFANIQMAGATPMVAAGLPVSVLQAPSAATLTFTGRSPLVPDTAAWIESLEAIPNFADAYVTSMAIAEEDNDGVRTAYYEVNGSVEVTEDAYALRFAEQEGD